MGGYHSIELFPVIFDTRIIRDYVESFAISLFSTKLKDPESNQDDIFDEISLFFVVVAAVVFLVFFSRIVTLNII